MTTKKISKISSSKQNPFKRPGSSYKIIWDCLYHYRRRGISRDKLVGVVTKQLKLNGIEKEEIKILWDIGVVCSARKDRLSHRSIRKQSDCYYIEVSNQHFKLHLK